MFSNLWGSQSTPTAVKPLIYPECETPSTKQEYEDLSRRKYEMLLDLEKDDGWLPVAFKDADVQLFEKKSIEHPALDIVKVRAVINASVQVPRRKIPFSTYIPPQEFIG